jgi:hypothetical protein
MVHNCFRNIVFIVVGLVCAASYGEELPDLIARLEKLDGKDPIRGEVRIEDRSTRTQEQEKGSKQLEKADLTITANANALTLTVTGEVSNSRVFREFSLRRAGELVHYGPSLVRELDGLKLVEKLPDSYKGLSCTQWCLKSEKKESRFGFSSTTRRDVELWIDAEGYPVAASFKIQNKGRMLLFKFTSESARQQRYERLGGRLVLVFDNNETDIKSKAGDEKRTVTTTFDVKKD